MKKLVPYYVHTILKWHSFEILSKTVHFEIVAIRTRGLGFQLSHQDHKFILDKLMDVLFKLEFF